MLEQRTIPDAIALAGLARELVQNRQLLVSVERFDAVDLFDAVASVEDEAAVVRDL